MPGTDVSQTVKLLALMGSIHPESRDVLPPHHCVDRGYLDWASLNPQPLPPHPPDRLVLGAIRMSNRLVALAVEDAARNGGPPDWVSEVIDDWCATPWPRKWPWPGPGPAPSRDQTEGPRPEPWALATAKASGALVFASLAVRLGAGELRDVLINGAERLAEAAVNEI